MSKLTVLGTRAENFFFAPSSATPLAYFRICFGIFAIVEMLCLRPQWLDLFGEAGIIQWLISKEVFAFDILPHLQDAAGLLEHLGASADDTVYIVLSAYIVALVSLTAGFYARLSALFAWGLHALIWNTSCTFAYGVDSFTRVCLFYFIFMPVSGCLALTRDTSQDDREQNGWQATLSFRVLQLHLCIIYFTSGLAKSLGEEWLDGQSMWRIFVQSEYAQFEMGWLANVPWLVVFLGWLVLFIEIGYPVLIWPKWTRPFMLASILGMHIGIGLFMGLWGFATVMILMNIFAFGWCTDFRWLLPRRASGLAVA